MERSNFCNIKVQGKEGVTRLEVAESYIKCKTEVMNHVGDDNQIIFNVGDMVLYWERICCLELR